MEAVHAVVRANAYVDSITLLQLTSQVRAMDGVADAAVVMATDLNRAVLADGGLLVEDAKFAGPNDLVIAVRADESKLADEAIARAEALLSGRREGVQTTSGAQRPRSLRSAHRVDPEADLAIISVPGPFAASEARQALADGLNVFLFSDNVALEDEIQLKQEATERGLLVMGPDCGTAIIGGVGFGFANVIRRGHIGVVGASGTGIQELTCLLHHMGAGISHAIGTGGRDLYARVGGATTLQALDLLREDVSTETIVLVSKPPDANVARRVLCAAADTRKPVVACLAGANIDPIEGVHLARNLEEAARVAAGAAEQPNEDAAPHAAVADQQCQIRGLFCGGTLCEEAARVIGETAAASFVDFGDDQYTRGRAHPMIDPTLRNDAIVRAGADPRVGILLLDVILGFAAHSDPASASVPAIEAAQEAAARDGRQLAVLAHVVGTDRDPQDFAKQEATLRAAGVQLFPSNYAAAVATRKLLERSTAR